MARCVNNGAHKLKRVSSTPFDYLARSRLFTRGKSDYANLSPGLTKLRAARCRSTAAAAATAVAGVRGCIAVRLVRARSDAHLCTYTLQAGARARRDGRIAFAVTSAKAVARYCILVRRHTVYNLKTFKQIPQLFLYFGRY